MTKAPLFRLEGNGDSLFVVDGDGRITFWNDRAAEALGWPAGEAVGRQCWDVLQGRGENGEAVCRPRCPGLLGSAAPPASSCLDVRTRDHERRWVNVNHVCVTPYNPAGDGIAESRAIIHIVHDVTEQRRLEGFARAVLQMSEEVRAAPRAGAAGQGGVRLSYRQRHVLELMAQGLTTAAMAQQMNVRPSTVRTHVETLLKAMGVHSRLQAVHMARRRGLLP